jgi:predicted transcriptional regulator
MAKANRLDLDDGLPIPQHEDEETLAAIDEGIRDADGGRTVASEEVRKLLPTWLSASNTRKER